MACQECRSPIAAALVCLLLAACGGGGGAGGADPGDDDPSSQSPPPAPEASVDERLTALGADTPDGPRVDEEGKPLPDDYSPLGSRRRMGEADSIGLVGWTPVAAPSSYRLATFELDDTDPPHLVVEQQTLSTDSTLETWTVKGAIPVSRHAAYGLDMDGDAVDEQVIAYLADGGADDSEIRLRIHVAASDGEPASERDELLLDEEVTIRDLTVAGGDLDGDGVLELVVGYSTPFGGRIRIASVVAGTFVLTPFDRMLPPETPQATVLLEIEAGQIDKDAPFELAVVRNEFTRSGNAYYQPRASACMVWDDLTTDMAELVMDPLVFEGTAGPAMAYPVDLAVGDIDADGMDEIVFAGIYDTTRHNIGSYAVRVYDDLDHELEVLDEHAVTAAVGRDGAGYDEPSNAYVHWVHVGVVDFEGDKAGEIHVNEVVYHDWLDGERWTKWTEIPGWFPEYANWLNVEERVDQSTTAMVKGDFDGDGREDLAVWAKRRAGISVWGLDTRRTVPDFGKLIDVPLPTSEHDGEEFILENPVLFRATVDNEATLLEFVSHQVFTSEPMVLAVIAAPPTLGRDQNLDGSETAYGTSTSSGGSASAELGFSVGLIVGSEFKQWGNGWEVEVQGSAEFGKVYESSEQTTEGVAYSTGWSEDSVVCTVTTYDRYVYRVIAHPNPDAIGELLNMDLPRGAPQTFQVEREFYNENVARPATRIGAEILAHRIGDPESYPTAARKDELVASREGEATESRTVGQGTGSATTVSLVIEEESSEGRFIGASVDIEAKTTVAALTIGGTFSASSGSEWQWSWGSATEFSGTVGSLHEQAFIEDRYQFGLLAYWHRDESNQVGFQVVTYYVPRSSP